MPKIHLSLPEYSAQEIQHFQAKTQTTLQGCWLFTSRTNPKLYGVFTVRRGDEYLGRMAHRIAYYVYYGVDPAHNQVCHRCDNPPCVNPFHLFLGSAFDNMQDCAKKGRFPKHRVNVGRGERQHLAKLTDDKVREIRRLNKEEGIGCHRLARMFHVTPANIKYINRGITWKHVA